MRDAAAQALGIRSSDVDHILRSRLLTHADTARWGWGKHDVVLLYRQDDLDRLARSRRIGWAAVRATPRATDPPRGAPTQKPAGR